MRWRGARPEIAELAGTFFLVAVGAGAAMLGSPWTALVPGIVVGACVYAFGRVSGAHFNPAVTLAFAACGEFPWRRAASYAGAQFAGALSGAVVVLLALPGGASAMLTLPKTGLALAILAEIGVTFVLMFVIMGAAVDTRVPRWSSGLAIGLAVVAGVAITGPLTGGSMNPARSLGPALVLAQGEGIWLYFAAPSVGALLAAFAYSRLRGASHHRPGARGEVK